MSNVFFDVGELPCEVDVVWLSTSIAFQSNAYEWTIWWHHVEFIPKVEIQIACNQPTMSEHEVWLVVLEFLEISSRSSSRITPWLSSQSFEIRVHESLLLFKW